MNSDDRLVRVVTGKLGSGKTFYAVMQAMQALMRQEVVVSNVHLNWPAVHAYCKRHGVEVPRANYRYVPSDRLEGGMGPLTEVLSRKCMLLLDEIHLFMDSREHRKNAELSGEFQTLLTQARKLDIDVWLISQSAANVDARLVRQATYIVRVSNWLHFPLLGTLFPFPVTLARVCSSDGKSVLSRDWIFRSSKIGNVYNTKQEFRHIELGGAPAVTVRGRKRRRTGYGVVLFGAGLLCHAVDFWLDRERYDMVAAYKEKHGGAPDQPSVTKDRGPEGPPAAVPQGPQPLSGDALLDFEASLPAVVSTGDRFVYLENGGRLGVGTPLGQGYVRAWAAREGGCVTVFTDSTLTPSIRFYERSVRPYLCYADGTPWRRGVGRDLSYVSSDPRSGNGLVGGVGVKGQRNPWLEGGNFSAPAGNRGDVGELGETGGPAPYQAPAPFIPEMTSRPSRLAEGPTAWLRSERVGK